MVCNAPDRSPWLDSGLFGARGGVGVVGGGAWPGRQMYASLKLLERPPWPTGGDGAFAFAPVPVPVLALVLEPELVLAPVLAPALVLVPAAVAAAEEFGVC